MNLLHRELTGKIIGAYYHVYNAMSRNYPEYIYENGMITELREQGVRCQKQPEYQIFYKHKLVGVQKLDLFIADEVVVELKHEPKLLKIHKAQAISYLKATGKTVGLLFNFGAEAPEFNRLISTEGPNPPAESEKVESESDADLSLYYPDLTYRIRQALYEVHADLGPGFIARIYANACYHEFRLSEISASPLKEMSVFYKNQNVGTIKFHHFCVADKVMVFPVALEQMADVKISNLKDWMQHQQIGFGLIANFKETSLMIKTVTV